MVFIGHVRRWNLIPDGSPIVTRSGRLLPVRRRGEPAMLKLATEEEERFGGVLMEWWDGDGAARVLARDDDAFLLERAEGPPRRNWSRGHTGSASWKLPLRPTAASSSAVSKPPARCWQNRSKLACCTAHHGNVLDFGVRGKRQRATSPETSPSAFD